LQGCLKVKASILSSILDIITPELKIKLLTGIGEESKMQTM